MDEETPYGYPEKPASTHGSSEDNRPIIILILGIVGIIFCQLTAPVAWFMGHKYRREMADQGLEPDGMGTAGWVLGIIGTILFVLGLCVLVVMMVTVFSAASEGIPAGTFGQ